MHLSTLVCKIDTDLHAHNKTFLCHNWPLLGPENDSKKCYWNEKESTIWIHVTWAFDRLLAKDMELHLFLKIFLLLFPKIWHYLQKKISLINNNRHHLLRFFQTYTQKIYFGKTCIFYWLFKVSRNSFHSPKRNKDWVFECSWKAITKSLKNAGGALDVL